MKQTKREASQGGSERQAGPQLIQEEKQHGFAHFLHELTACLPLLPIALLALFSHLWVYAWSYGGWRGTFLIGPFWLLSLALFVWEMQQSFRRSSDSLSGWRGFLGWPSNSRLTAREWRKAFWSFGSALSVVVATTLALLLLPLAVKSLASMLFVDGCLPGTPDCGFRWKYFVSISGGAAIFVWIVMRYRPGIYGATVRWFEDQPRPYLVMLLSLEKLAEENRKKTGRDPAKVDAHCRYYGFSAPVQAGQQEPPVLTQMRDYWTGKVAPEGAPRQSFDGTVAFAWCGVKPHAEHGVLKRIFVVTTRQSCELENLRCLQKCHEAFGVLAKELNLKQGAFDILVIHFGGSDDPLVTPLDDLIEELDAKATAAARMAAETPVAELPAENAGKPADAVQEAGSQASTDRKRREKREREKAVASEFESVQLLARALSEVEERIKKDHAPKSKWGFDAAQYLMIDITGGQKIASAVGVLHGYGRPMLAQYVRPDFAVLTVDALPRPGPHF